MHRESARALAKSRQCLYFHRSLLAPPAFRKFEPLNMEATCIFMGGPRCATGCHRSGYRESYLRLEAALSIGTVFPCRALHSSRAHPTLCGLCARLFATEYMYSAYPTLRATYRILLPFARFFPASRSEEFPLFQRQRDVSRRNRRNKFFSFSISFCMCFVSFVCKIITFHFSFLAQQPPFRKKIAHRLAFLKSIM